MGEKDLTGRPDPGDVVPPTASPDLPPAAAGPQHPAAGGIPWPLFGAALVAGAALGAMAGIRIGRAIAMQNPVPVEFLRVHECEECAKRKEAEAIAATSPSDVERLVSLQAEVEHAGDTDGN